jgi:arylsulfatase
MASHLGGTRDPMAVAWPARIKADGRIRPQFTHVIDVGPTILEVVGLPEARLVDGIAQEPMDGTSFAYTFDAPDAPERHTLQYFEMLGSRGIYKDGWWACTRLDKAPWDMSPQTMARFGPGSGWDPDADPWELYYLPEDFSQARNIAADHPEKLTELQDVWWSEAERNRALPLLGAFCIFYGIVPPLPTNTRFRFHGDVQNIQRGMIPRIQGRSYSIEADIHVPDGGAEGVIVANADHIGGFGLWVDEAGLLHHTYSFLGVETYRQVATEPLPTGDVTVRMLFEADEAKPGTGGKATLLANGKVIGEGLIPRTVPVAFTSYGGMDIGRDNGLPVDLEYKDKSPYPFTGIVRTVVFDLKPAPIDEQADLHQIAVQAGMAHGAAG